MVRGLGLGVQLGLGADVQTGLQEVRRRGDCRQSAGRGEGGAGGRGKGGGRVLPGGVLQAGRGQALGWGLLGLGQEEGGASGVLGKQGGRRKETGGRGRGLMRLWLVLHLKHPVQTEGPGHTPKHTLVAENKTPPKGDYRDKENPLLTSAGEAPPPGGCGDPGGPRRGRRGPDSGSHGCPLGRGAEGKPAWPTL